jgi:FtsP/CotA-like multicopper oxidase with cupredoxin domain
MFIRKLSPFWLLLLIFFAAGTTRAQVAPVPPVKNPKAQGGGSFMVQCPNSTVWHPGSSVLGYDPASNEGQYTGPNTVSVVVDSVPLKYTLNGGAIKCQEISGGDGYMTEADGNQTFMFSFGPLSGMDLIKHGQPGTQFAADFNNYYNSPFLPSACANDSPSTCQTAGPMANSADPTYDSSRPISLNGAVADPAQIMTIGVMNGNLPMPLAAFDEDDEFFLTLSNVGMIMRPDLFEQHTVHFHGYPNASSFYDGVPDATWAINIGGSATYYYLAPDAGTYFYHCHITPPEHLQMGMVGQLYVRPRQNRVPVGNSLYASLQLQQNDLRTACVNTGANSTLGSVSPDILCSTPVPAASNTIAQVVDPFAGVDPRIPTGTPYKYAYNDGDASTRYDIDVPMQIHGFDPNFHFVGMTFNPEGFADMKDKYFLLNGRSYPDTVGVPGYAGGPAVASAAANFTTTPVTDWTLSNTGNPDPNSRAVGTEDSDGRTRFSQPLPSLITLIQGERALLRLSDLDVTEYQTLASLGIPMQLVGFQAKLLRDQSGNNLPIVSNSVTIGGGESVDVILDSCLVRAADMSCTTLLAPGIYFLYTPNLDHLSNDAENFGGLMTEVQVCASASACVF